MVLELLARLTLDLSHLNKHKFDKKFSSCFDPSLNEDTIHFFLHCHHYIDKIRL